MCIAHPIFLLFIKSIYFSKSFFLFNASMK